MLAAAGSDPMKLGCGLRRRGGSACTLLCCTCPGCSACAHVCRRACATLPPCPPRRVQVRQHVSHKRTFFFLEQLILKHGADESCVNVKEMHEVGCGRAAGAPRDGAARCLEGSARGVRPGRRAAAGQEDGLRARSGWSDRSFGQYGAGLRRQF